MAKIRYRYIYNITCFSVYEITIFCYLAFLKVRQTCLVTVILGRRGCGSNSFCSSNGITLLSNTCGVEPVKVRR